MIPHCPHISHTCSTTFVSTSSILHMYHINTLLVKISEGECSHESFNDIPIGSKFLGVFEHVLLRHILPLPPSFALQLLYVLSHEGGHTLPTISGMSTAMVVDDRIRTAPQDRQWKKCPSALNRSRQTSQQTICLDLSLQSTFQGSLRHWH